MAILENYYYSEKALQQKIKKVEEEGGGGGSSFEPTETQLEAMNSGINTTKVTQIQTNKNDIDTLKENLANYIGSFATHADLLAYSGTLSNNDYAVVLADETHSNQCWRYVYNSTLNQWLAQYEINEEPMTQSQLDAINSGIDSTKVTQIQTNKDDLTNIKTVNQQSNDPTDSDSLSYLNGTTNKIWTFTKIWNWCKDKILSITSNIYTSTADNTLFNREGAYNMYNNITENKDKGWTNIISGVQYCCKNRVVSIRMVGISVSVDANGIIASVPNGYRPTQETPFCYGIDFGAVMDKGGWIATNGEIRVHVYSTTLSQVRMFITYTI